MTREKFIKSIVSSHSNTYLYKTGDLGRYLPDGNIEFMGRMDNQIKIRGFRVELGEIELVLLQHPAVKETAVITIDSKVDKRIIAYYTLNGNMIVKEENLCQFLKEKLPAYMIPPTFIKLDTFPMTSGGKINRKALPNPDKTKTEPGQYYVAPRTVLEFKLTTIWEALLEKRPISITSNFFKLGGHSILAVRLASQIQATIGLTLPLRDLFQAPTIEGQAGILNRQPESGPRSPIVAIQKSGSTPPLFCIHHDGGTSICYLKLSHHLGCDQPVYGLHARGTDDENEPLTSIENMATIYINAIRTIQPKGPYRLAGWSFGGVVAFEMARQLENQSGESPFLAIFDSDAPLPSHEQKELDDAELLSILIGDTISLSMEELRQMKPDQQLNYAISEAGKKNILPPGFGVEQAKRFLNVIRANDKAFRSYDIKPLNGKIHFFKASETLPKTLQAFGTNTDPVSIWNEFTAKGVQVHNTPGNHRNMMSDPHVKNIARKLQEIIKS